MEKYRCCLTKEEKARDRDCNNCEGFYHGTDCECADLNRGRTEQLLVTQLREEIDKLKSEKMFWVTAYEELISDYHKNKFIRLPCAIGEQLYCIRTAVNSNKKRLGKATTLSYRNMGYVLQQYRKTMFTKEEAERKIREEI